MKLTIHPQDIHIGDYVVGHRSPVAHMQRDGHDITVTMANGAVWHTVDHFETTVIRIA